MKYLVFFKIVRSCWSKWNAIDSGKPGDEAEHSAEILVLVSIEQVLELGVEDLEMLLNQHLGKQSMQTDLGHFMTKS